MIYDIVICNCRSTITPMKIGTCALKEMLLPLKYHGKSDFWSAIKKSDSVR